MVGLSKSNRRWAYGVIACATTLGSAAQAAPNLVVNGGFESGVIGSAPASWTQYNNVTAGAHGVVEPTPYTFCCGTPATIPASPVGGNIYIGQAYGDASYQDTVITQQITGLVAGQTYTLSWYDAAGTSGQSGGTFAWEANLGATGYSPPTSTTTTGNVNSPFTYTGGTTFVGDTMPYLYAGWHFNSFTFVANASSEPLYFAAVGLSTGPTNIALDGVSITASPVPEPGSGILMLSAGAVFLALRRRRR